MLEDYRHKIENLTLERLQDLTERYQKTIEAYEKRLREAHVAGMTAVATYQETELTKKRQELIVIEEIIKIKKTKN